MMPITWAMRIEYKLLDFVNHLTRCRLLKLGIKVSSSSRVFKKYFTATAVENLKLQTLAANIDFVGNKNRKLLTAE